MSLVLSSADAARLRAAGEALLSPLDGADTGAWTLAVLHRVRELHAVVERHALELPRAEDLQSRGQLTPREAQVALLLAIGCSDREVARLLALSPHTVRKHAEHIFDKLRLRSRKALLLRLLEAAWPAPGAGVHQLIELEVETPDPLRPASGVPHRVETTEGLREPREAPLPSSRRALERPTAVTASA